MQEQVQRQRRNLRGRAEAAEPPVGAVESHLNTADDDDDDRITFLQNRGDRFRLEVQQVN